MPAVALGPFAIGPQHVQPLGASARGESSSAGVPPRPPGSCSSLTCSQRVATRPSKSRFSRRRFCFSSPSCSHCISSWRSCSRGKGRDEGLGGGTARDTPPSGRPYPLLAGLAGVLQLLLLVFQLLLVHLLRPLNLQLQSQVKLEGKQGLWGSPNPIPGLGPSGKEDRGPKGDGGVHLLQLLNSLGLLAQLLLLLQGPGFEIPQLLLQGGWGTGVQAGTVAELLHLAAERCHPLPQALLFQLFLLRGESMEVGTAQPPLGRRPWRG